jgi:signal transduction histidine kinase
MTAGIAHEINNPINFVSSNILPLKRDIQDILSVLEMFSSLKNAAEYDEKIEEIRQKMQRLDIDYTKQEIAQLLSGIDEGSRRTAEIVKSLRIFSRMDRDDLVSANINECINSTLVIMKSVTKGEVTIRKKLADNFPMMDCYPGKLNQVIMNILNNAVYATRVEGRKKDDRFIDIETSFDDQTITISIEDNGVGIPDDIRSKIFDPFFTTKGVGEGTGLGLSIALGIVEEHRGQIHVHSELGKGTRFTLTLPRKTTKVSQEALAA